MKYPTLAELLAAKGRRGGDPMTRWRRSYVVEPSGCWRWIKAPTGSGYGHFHVLGRYYQAHHIAYILHVGPVPAGLELDHLCRNRWCVNPAHVEPVTHAVNMYRGARARLSPMRIAVMRAAHRAGVGTRELGRRYGVDHSTVSRALRGETWREIDPRGVEVPAA